MRQLSFNIPGKKTILFMHRDGGHNIIVSKPSAGEYPHTRISMSFEITVDGIAEYYGTQWFEHLRDIRNECTLNPRRKLGRIAVDAQTHGQI